MRAEKALAFVAGLAMAYLFGSFVAWDLNPGAWDQGGRFMLGSLGVLLGIFMASEA